eukprot:scaffold157665_cov21-Tisochrysis_lutea.AAC.1
MHACGCILANNCFGFRNRSQQVHYLEHTYSYSTHFLTCLNIIRVTKGEARAVVGPSLSAKYRMAMDNRQTVVSITNCWTFEQTVFKQVNVLVRPA